MEHPEGGKVWIRPPEATEIPEIHRLLLQEVSPDAGPVEAMMDVFAHNSDSLWAIECGSPAGTVSIIGFYAFLMLNRAGLSALQAGTLQRTRPPLACLAPFGEEPAAIYVWAVVARRLAKRLRPLIARALGTLYKDVPIFAFVATEGGRKAGADRGFTASGAGAQLQVGQLMQLPAWSERQSAPVVRAIVASTPEHMQQVVAIRGAVFMSEQDCPYEEEFDGNDYCATHIVGTVDGKPAAVMRIRYFAGFAKLERLAVLKAYRGGAVARAVVEAAFEMCRRKGYVRVYGHSQARLVGFWEKFGFKRPMRNSPLVFSDHDYVEIVAELAPHAAAITLQSDPYLIIRPEGSCDAPGILERSAARPATNPH
ncbi:MAG: GNAT family N-acetyltransferase [Rhizomicrobium sp.]